MKHTVNILNLVILNYFFEFIISNNVFYILLYFFNYSKIHSIFSSFSIGIKPKAITYKFLLLSIIDITNIEKFQ